MYSGPVKGRFRSAVRSSGFMRLALPLREGEGPHSPDNRAAAGPIRRCSGERVLLRKQADDPPGFGTVDHRQRVALGVLEHRDRLLDRHLWQQHCVRVVQQFAHLVVLIGIGMYLCWEHNPRIAVLVVQYQDALMGAEGEVALESRDGCIGTHRAHLATHHAAHREVAHPADIDCAADRLAAQVETPGGERVPKVRRTVSAEMTQAASTATVSGRLPVLSSARKPMVNGPPMIATARALMPTSAQTTADTAWAVLTAASVPANSLPTSAPRNSEAKNRPPRKPEPIETAEANDFSTTSRAT